MKTIKGVKTDMYDEKQHLEDVYRQAIQYHLKSFDDKTGRRILGIQVIMHKLDDVNEGPHYHVFKVLCNAGISNGKDKLSSNEILQAKWVLEDAIRSVLQSGLQVLKDEANLLIKRIDVNIFACNTTSLVDRVTCEVTKLSSTPPVVSNVMKPSVSMQQWMVKNNVEILYKQRIQDAISSFLNDTGRIVTGIRVHGCITAPPSLKYVVGKVACDISGDYLYVYAVQLKKLAADINKIVSSQIYKLENVNVQLLDIQIFMVVKHTYSSIDRVELVVTPFESKEYRLFDMEGTTDEAIEYGKHATPEEITLIKELREKESAERARYQKEVFIKTKRYNHHVAMCDIAIQQANGKAFRSVCS
jgi:hypothetical protein